MKKLLCLLLAAVTVFGAAGCSKSEDSASNKEYTVNVFTMRVSPDPESSIMQEIQEKLGCKLNVSAVPDNDYQSKLNLLITSGDIPDIYGSNNLTTYKAAATLTEDLIKKNCPEIYSDFLNTCEFAGVTPQTMFDRWSVDGKIKAFHNGSTTVLPYSIVIRTDILEDLGIGIPQTIGDWDKAFELFKAKNPSKYPVTAMRGGPIGAFYMWLTAYGIVRSQWTLHEDGPNGPYLQYPDFEPGMRDALLKFREWYQKGYVNPEMATMLKDNTIWESEFINGNTFVAQYIALSQQLWIKPPFGNADSVMAKCYAVNPEATFDVCPFPTLDGSDKKTLVNAGFPFSGYVTSFGKQLEKDPEKLDFVMNMWERLFSDPDLYFLARYGREGETYDMVNGTPVVRAEYGTNEDRNRAGFGWPFNGMFNTGPRVQEKLLTDFAKDLRNTYYYNEGAIYSKEKIEYSNYPRVTGDLIDENGNDVAALDKSYETEMDAMFFNVISGAKTIEDFDAFIARWKADIGDRMVALANDLYLDQWIKE